MIVRDKSSELEAYLKSFYEDTLSQIEEDSTHQEALALKNSKDDANIKANIITSKAKKQAKSYDLMQQSSGRLEAQRKKQEAQIELINKVREDIINLAKNMSNTQKQAFFKALKKTIETQITSHGFKKQDFVFSCPKEVKLEGCKSELENLAIEAKSETVNFKVGLTELIQAKQDEIKKHILRYIEDHIEE